MPSHWRNWAGHLNVENRSESFSSASKNIFSLTFLGGDPTKKLWKVVILGLESSPFWPNWDKNANSDRGYPYPQKHGKNRVRRFYLSWNPQNQKNQKKIGVTWHFLETPIFYSILWGPKRTPWQAIFKNVEYSALLAINGLLKPISIIFWWGPPPKKSQRKNGFWGARKTLRSIFDV